MSCSTIVLQKNRAPKYAMSCHHNTSASAVPIVLIEVDRVDVQHYATDLETDAWWGSRAVDPVHTTDAVVTTGGR